MLLCMLLCVLMYLCIFTMYVSVCMFLSCMICLHFIDEKAVIATCFCGWLLIKYYYYYYYEAITRYRTRISENGLYGAALR